jgi:hypothetical protein
MFSLLTYCVLLPCFLGSVMNAHMSFYHKRVDPYLC